MPRRSKPAVDRVLARVVKQPDGCWIWRGALNEGGYGIVQLGRGIGTDRTHRVVYRAMVGEIPAGLTLDHLCHRPACVNPAHLDPVTRTENTLRQWAVGKGNAGASNVLKTHCPHGHPYDEANTRKDKNGRRHCRTCERLRAQRWRDRRD